MPGLAYVNFLVAEEPTTAVMVLQDTEGREARFALGAEGLRKLVTPLLGIATKWADTPDLEAEKFSGPMHALPATAVAFVPGRTPNRRRNSHKDRPR